MSLYFLHRRDVEHSWLKRLSSRDKANKNVQSSNKVSKQLECFCFSQQRHWCEHVLAGPYIYVCKCVSSCVCVVMLVHWENVVVRNLCGGPVVAILNSTVINMSMKQLFRTAHSEPMIAIGRGLPANEEAYNILRLRNSTAPERWACGFSCSVFLYSADSHFELNSILSPIIRWMASADRCNWPITRSAWR